MFNRSESFNSFNSFNLFNLFNLFNVFNLFIRVQFGPKMYESNAPIGQELNILKV